MAPKTCTHGFQWSFTLSLTIDVVNRFAKKCKQIEAFFFAYSFGIMNHVQHVPLLKTYLKEAHKTTQFLLKIGKQNNLTIIQVIKIHLQSCGYGFLFLSYKLTWNTCTHGIFLFCNSLEDLLTYAVCFDAKWCNNEGIGNAQNNVEVYWKMWSKKPISFNVTPSFEVF